MARKIIILDRVDEPGDFNFRYVLWADVPSARQPFYADPLKTSLVKDVTAGELSALRAGQIIETSGTSTNPASATQNSVKADLIARFTVFQAQVNGNNPWKFYGTFWDGTTWTAGGAS